MEEIRYYGLKHVRKFANGTYGSGAYAIDGIPVIWKTGEWKDASTQMPDIVDRETYDLECSDMHGCWGKYDEFVAWCNDISPNWYEEDEINFHAYGFGYIPETEGGLTLVEVEISRHLEHYGPSNMTVAEFTKDSGFPEITSPRMRIIGEATNFPDKPCYEVPGCFKNEVMKVRIPGDHPASELFTWGGVRIWDPMYEVLTKAMILATAIMRS